VPNPHHCRACQAPLTETFVDLGATPLANSYLAPDDRDLMEPHYPALTQQAMVTAACALFGRTVPDLCRPVSAVLNGGKS